MIRGELAASGIRWGDLGKSWDSSGVGTRLWREIEALAVSFWRVVPHENDEWTDETLQRWHHLALAVSNFKRSSGRLVPVPGLRPDAGGDVERPSELHLPGMALLRRDDSPPGLDAAFRTLRSHGKGFGVATATTLLSALWPSHHAIIDRRAFGALLVLDPEGWTRLRALHRTALDSGGWAQPTWDDYGWYLGRLRQIVAGARLPALRDAERALYALGSPSRGGRGWPAYRDEVRRRASASPPRG